MNKIGIYIIENIVNNKKYIGKSINIFQRWSVHKHGLNKGEHPNILLQRAWNKYGKDCFIFQIAEECAEEELWIKEEYYINKFDSFDNGYNLTSGGEKGYDVSEEGKSRMREYIKEFRNSYTNNCLICGTQTKNGWARYCSLHKYRCTKCENRIPVRSKLCVECTNNITVSKKERSMVEVFTSCEKCGIQISKKSNRQKYCGYCSKVVYNENKKHVMRKRRGSKKYSCDIC